MSKNANKKKNRKSVAVVAVEKPNLFDNVTVAEALGVNLTDAQADFYANWQADIDKEWHDKEKEIITSPVAETMCAINWEVPLFRKILSNYRAEHDPGISREILFSDCNVETIDFVLTAIDVPALESELQLLDELMEKRYRMLSNLALAYTFITGKWFSASGFNRSTTIKQLRADVLTHSNVA